MRFHIWLRCGVLKRIQFVRWAEDHMLGGMAKVFILELLSVVPIPKYPAWETVTILHKYTPTL